MDGTQPEGTTVDSRDMKYPFRGAIYQQQEHMI